MSNEPDIHAYLDAAWTLQNPNSGSQTCDRARATLGMPKPVAGSPSQELMVEESGSGIFTGVSHDIA